MLAADPVHHRAHPDPPRRLRVLARAPALPSLVAKTSRHSSNKARLLGRQSSLLRVFPLVVAEAMCPEVLTI